MQMMIKEKDKFKFLYKGEILPTKDMKDWFSYNIDNYNEEELKMKFFKRFKNELKELSYFKMLDIFTRAKINI